MLDAVELAAWLRLLSTPGIGRRGARMLLAVFGLPQDIFSASEAQLSAAASQAAAGVLRREPPGLAEHIRLAEAWLAEGGDRKIVSLGDDTYPPLLLQTEDPPLLLFLQGRVSLLKAQSIAIVGSRHPTPQGKDNAREFGACFSAQGLTVVSGMAVGIDGAAHEGGLQADGSTIAVWGTGLDRVYPAQHRALAHRIAERGLLVSEFFPGTPPRGENFPQRNRIIAGLSLGTLVVEAAVRSGSLITARQAAEMGREVFAIPGSIHSPQARGCHALIKQGAKLVECAQDVLQELRMPQPADGTRPAEPTAVLPPEDAPPADPLIEALGHDPATLDSLSARTGWSPAALSAHLLELELDGHVVRLPGGLFQRRAAG